MPRPSILVVGSANMDLVVRAPRLPGRGETVSGRDFRTVPGGKGANQAVACARLGVPTSFVASVGRDAFGDELLEGYMREGIDIDHVRRDNAEPTGVALIMVEDEGENCIMVAPGANARCAPDQVSSLAGESDGFGAILVQLEIPLETVGAALEVGKQKGMITFLDPAPARRLPRELLGLVDVMTPNANEAGVLLGGTVSDMEQAIEAASALRDHGPRIVALKLGEKGVVVACEGRTYHVPAQRVEAVDGTAAGDAFSAALAVAMVEGRSTEEAVEIAACAGALAATVFGAQPSLPTRDELIAFCHERGCASRGVS